MYMQTRQFLKSIHYLHNNSVHNNFDCIFDDDTSLGVNKHLNHKNNSLDAKCLRKQENYAIPQFII